MMRHYKHDVVFEDDRGLLILYKESNSHDVQRVPLRDILPRLQLRVASDGRFV